MNNGHLQMKVSKDDTMKGLFGVGDPFLVDTSVKRFMGDGVYIFRVDGMEFTRSLQSTASQSLMAIPRNKGYEEWAITEDMDLEIIGHVVKAWQQTLN